MDDNVSQVFSSFQFMINSEQDLREEIRVIVREIEQAAREVLSTVQISHQADGLDQIPVICEKADQQFSSIGELYKKLSAKVGNNQYYKYYDHWRFVTQRLCFLISFVGYLRDDKLLTREEVAETLRVESDRSSGFHLDLEDYLMGLLLMSSELARFAVNSVTAGDYNQPIKISKFVSQLNSGFRLLNLKNDSLRKKFDALKYDVKKIEEVVYDLSIRGLKPNDSSAP